MKEDLCNDEIPGEDRCLLLLARHGVPEQVVAHSKMVTAVARKIAVLLLQKGLKLDLNLITAAGLLHDLAKGMPNHAEEGKRIIAALGYPRVAAVVATHIDIVPAGDSPPVEDEILYLADRLVRGDHLVSLEERFRDTEKRFGSNAAAARAVRRRFDCARRIKARIENILGEPVEVLWGRETSNST